MKRIILLNIVLMLAGTIACPAFAQPAVSETARSTSGQSAKLYRMQDSLVKQFSRKNLHWPPEAMYVRSFKYDKQLEVWVQNPGEDNYRLFKTYKVCIQSGSMGPKRLEGDYQVPEGFYYINEFNPNSMYHLSLGLNYPNASDRILSDNLRPGNNIYIHGNCVSTGCIPIMDVPMEELYLLASTVKAVGAQEFIPVHVFPVKYNVKKSSDYLSLSIQNNPYLQDFNAALQQAFQYFEINKQVPVVLVNRAGDYLVNGK
ncbi:MAG: hypothetical protein EOO01_13745 [Chitinophagaceae bacterium]|nr:MAG: hypothetical protein EOO01_13745 [Chitinophagaceae bacterium]